jgi:hypothetical protein
MQHDVDFSAKHPVTPLRDCPPYIQELFNFTAKQAAVTKDGHLQCQSTRS